MRPQKGFEVNPWPDHSLTHPITVSSAGFDGQTLFFTMEQRNQLLAAGLNSDAISRLDYVARQEGLDHGELSEAFDLLVKVADQAIHGTGGSIDDNTTTVLFQGHAVGEIPFSYGYAINEQISVGGSLKLIRGRVYGNKVLVFDENDRL